MMVTKTHAVEKKKIRACAYVRVSTKKEEQHYSFVTQSEYWQKKLGENEEFEYVGLFTDEGISGKSMKNRKGLNEMLDKALKGEIDRIYTKSISRFSRNYTELTATIRELRDMGIPIIFEREGINTLDPKCGLLLSILASLAEEELISMSKNLQWAARKRFANGSVELARIYGYRMIDKQLVINPEEAEFVKMIFRLYLEGNGVVKIARMMDESGFKPIMGGSKWGKSTIRDMLSNEKYIGDSLLQKTCGTLHKRRLNRGELPQYYIENSHEPIISKEDFAKVQEKLHESYLKYNLGVDYSVRYPLSGKIKCGVCGSNYHRKTCAKGKTYECRKWSCVVKDQRSKAACESHDIKDEVIEKLLVEAFNECLDKQCRHSGVESERDKLQELLKSERELKELRVKGYINESHYKNETERVISDIHKQEELLKAISSQNMNTSKYMKSAEFTKDMADFLVQATVKDWEVTFRFANGYETTRKYTNGRAGNVNGKLCKHKA